MQSCIVFVKLFWTIFICTCIENLKPRSSSTCSPYIHIVWHRSWYMVNLIWVNIKHAGEPLSLYKLKFFPARAVTVILPLITKRDLINVLLLINFLQIEQKLFCNIQKLNLIFIVDLWVALFWKFDFPETLAPSFFFSTAPLIIYFHHPWLFFCHYTEMRTWYLWITPIIYCSTLIRHL